MNHPENKSWVCAATRVKQFDLILPLGHYIYVEASGRKVGSVSTTLTSPKLSGVRCLHFWYHQNVRATHGLAVYIQKIGFKDDRSLAWQLMGGYGNMWQRATIPILITQSYQVLVQ